MKREQLIAEYMERPKEILAAFLADAYLHEKKIIDDMKDVVCDCCVPQYDDPFDLTNKMCRKCKGTININTI